MQSTLCAKKKKDGEIKIRVELIQYCCYFRYIEYIFFFIVMCACDNGIFYRPIEKNAAGWTMNNRNKTIHLVMPAPMEESLTSFGSDNVWRCQ